MIHKASKTKIQKQFDDIDEITKIKINWWIEKKKKKQSKIFLIKLLWILELYYLSFYVWFDLAHKKLNKSRK